MHFIKKISPDAQNTREPKCTYIAQYRFKITMEKVENLIRRFTLSIKLQHATNNPTRLRVLPSMFIYHLNNLN